MSTEIFGEILFNFKNDPSFDKSPQANNGGSGGQGGCGGGGGCNGGSGGSGGSGGNAITRHEKNPRLDTSCEG